MVIVLEDLNNEKGSFGNQFKGANKNEILLGIDYLSKMHCDWILIEENKKVLENFFPHSPHSSYASIKNFLPWMIKKSFELLEEKKMDVPYKSTVFEKSKSLTNPIFLW